MLQDDVWSYCEAHELIRPGGRVVVAVSGGSDSVALLHVLCLLRDTCGLDLVCAHFNHRMRGAESDEDEVVVRELARSLSIPFQQGSDDVRGYAAAHRLSIEEAARELRKRFLRSVAIQTGASCVATGHTRDDQVETVLFRLFKGTGMRGIAGIAPRSGMIVRPLLGTGRKDLRAWLTANGWSWREDTTNADERYERNYIRHHIIPLIEERFPTARIAVARASDMIRSACDVFEVQTEHVVNAVEILEAGDGRSPGALRIPRPTLEALPDPLLHYALEDLFHTAGVGPSYERLTRSVEALRKGGVGTRVTLDDKLSLEIGYRHVYVYGAALTNRTTDAVVVSAFPATVDWFRKRIDFEEKPASEAPADLKGLDPREAWFDLDMVAMPLVVRQPNPGDRVITFGGHNRKLQDLFVDTKVDRLLRRRRPVICDTAGVLWVPALVRGAAAPVTKESSRLLRIVYYSSQC